MRSRDVDGFSGAGRGLAEAAVRDDGTPGPRPPADLVLRTRPNWTATCFLGGLAFLHFSNAGISFAGGRYEGYLSLLFGTAILLVAVACSRFRFELALLGSRRQLRLRNGIGRFSLERFIPFSAVRGVRLTLSNAAGGTRRPESRIELLCPYEDVECPPTRVPRQEALFLAMLMGVPLIRVSDEPEMPPRA